jgi:hypothetical protein
MAKEQNDADLAVQVLRVGVLRAQGLNFRQQANFGVILKFHAVFAGDLLINITT